MQGMGNTNDKVRLSAPIALAALRTNMEEDPKLAGAWHDNLACIAMDEGVDIVVANKIAMRFMKSYFDVSTQRQ
jgi:hypothetical protein